MIWPVMRIGTSSQMCMFLLVHTIHWLMGSNNILIDGRNILRPETVESLMLAYRVTGDEQYREWGWQIFESFNKHCRVATGGYAGIEDVQKVPAKQVDRMETFWLGETLSKSKWPLAPKRGGKGGFSICWG
jgi:hypothetical protein